MDINATFLAQSLGIFYKHQAPIVVDCYTKYQQNQPFLFWDIATHKIYNKYSHNYLNLAWSQMLFYMRQQHMVPDNWTKYEYN